MNNPVLPICQIVMKRAENVVIDEKALDAIALHFSVQDMNIPDWELPVLPNGRTLEALNFIMFGNSLNFAYRDFKTKADFTTEYAGQEWRGAMAMWASLKRALDSGLPILDGGYLSKLSNENVADIFSGKKPIPLVKERASIMREVGEVLVRSYGGFFDNLFEESNHLLFNHGKGLVERLTQDFPSFNDSAFYKNRKVVFNKRAQLAAGMIYGRFRDQEDFHIKDVDKLTVFADYGLPKTMRHLGILVYAPSLAKKVDNQEIILAGSEEEIEIRAATIVAANMLIDRINYYRGVRKGQDNSINALHLDYMLWAESKNIKAFHHLTPTIKY